MTWVEYFLLSSSSSFLCYSPCISALPIRIQEAKASLNTLNSLHPQQVKQQQQQWWQKINSCSSSNNNNNNNKLFIDLGLLTLKKKKNRLLVYIQCFFGFWGLELITLADKETERSKKESYSLESALAYCCCCCCCWFRFIWEMECIQNVWHCIGQQRKIKNCSIWKISC